MMCFLASYPEEIVSQGEAAMRIYDAACNEENAVTVFLRVDVVGRDGAGKTSLTKSITLMKFDQYEPSTRGVIPMSRIIMKEACNWTVPVTSEHYRDLYNKNITAVMAEAFNKPEVKDKFLTLARDKKASTSKRNSKTSVKSSSKLMAIASPTDEQRDEQSDDMSMNGGDNLLEQPVAMRLEEVSNERQLLESLELNDESAHVSGDVTGEDRETRERSTEMCCSSDSVRDNVEAQGESVAGVSSETVVVTVDTDSSEKSEAKKRRNVQRRRRKKEASKMKTSDKRPSRQSRQTVTSRKKRKRTYQLSSQFSSDVQSTASTDTQQHQTQSKRGKKSKLKESRGQSQCSGSAAAYVNSESKADESKDIPESIKRRVINYLRNSESLQKAKDEIMVTILDYAGQHVFYTTHQLFLSRAAFYYVVFDASQPLGSQTASVFRKLDGKVEYMGDIADATNYERVEEWISAIHIMEAEPSYFMIFENVGIRSPGIFLVGTHTDVLRKEEGMLEKQDEFMKKKLQDTELSEHIIWASKDRMCFYVDNSMTDADSGDVDPQVQLLCRQTEEVARQVAKHDKLPITWLRFKEELHELKENEMTRKVVSVDELLQLAQRVSGIKTKEEFMVLLQYLSNRAVVLYHPKNEEKEVVLDVEWLMSQLEKVVTIHTDVPSMWKRDMARCAETGIMTQGCLDYLVPESSFPGMIKSLLKYYDLMCPYFGVDANSLEFSNDQQDYVNLKFQSIENKDEAQCQAYFVPCLLQKESSLLSTERPYSHKTVALILHSGNIRMPKPLFYRLLTRLAKRFCRLPQLFQNVGYFMVYHRHKLEISLDKHSLQMIVYTDHKNPLPAVCALVKDFVVTSVDEAKQQGMPGLKLQLGYMWSNPDHIGVDTEFVSLKGWNHLPETVYVKSVDNEVRLSETLHAWFPANSEVSYNL